MADWVTWGTGILVVISGISVREQLGPDGYLPPQKIPSLNVSGGYTFPYQTVDSQISQSVHSRARLD